VVPVLPFFAMAPSSFYRGVILAQLVRSPGARIALKTRLADLTGIVSTTSSKVSVPAAVVGLAVLLILVLIVGSCLAASLLTHKPPPPLEVFVLVSGLLVVLAFLWPVDFYYHYGGFFTPFLALAVALPVARLAEALRPAAARQSPRLRLEPVAIGLASAALLGMFLAQVATEASAVKEPDTAAVADKVIPSGACVLTDQVSFTIVAGRFTSSVPGCPQIVDGYGTDLDLGQGRSGNTGAARYAAVRQVWDNAFRHAQYVWLSTPPGETSGSADRRIAWTPWLRAYFAANFRKIHTPRHFYIYKRIGLPSA
jgi:hypothetical protein